MNELPLWLINLLIPVACMAAGAVIIVVACIVARAN